MNVPKVDIIQLLEAGVHLGHKTFRWNPKMKQYIFGEKNSIHIIDLTQTVEFLKNALVQVHKTISSGESTGFDESDITLTGPGTITNFTGSGTTYTADLEVTNASVTPVSPNQTFVNGVSKPVI